MCGRCEGCAWDVQQVLGMCVGCEAGGEVRACGGGMRWQCALRDVRRVLELRAKPPARSVKTPPCWHMLWGWSIGRGHTALRRAFLASPCTKDTHTHTHTGTHAYECMGRPGTWLPLGCLAA